MIPKTCLKLCPPIMYRYWNSEFIIGTTETRQISVLIGYISPASSADHRQGARARCAADAAVSVSFRATKSPAEAGLKVTSKLSGLSRIPRAPFRRRVSAGRFRRVGRSRAMRIVSPTLRGATTTQRNKTISFQLGRSARLKFNRASNWLGSDRCGARCHDGSPGSGCCIRPGKNDGRRRRRYELA